MYKIDWDARKIDRVSNKACVMRKINLAIATFVSLQITTFLVPNQLFAGTQSTYLQEDTPEEVLRAEIYTDARSPIDGKQLSAAEYTELMEKLGSLDSIPPEDLVSPKVREVIDLLKLRKFLRQFIPFIP